MRYVLFSLFLFAGTCGKKDEEGDCVDCAQDIKTEIESQELVQTKTDNTSSPNPSAASGSSSENKQNKTPQEEAIAIAKKFVGFSYYWGGAALKDGADKGSCSGNCPNCKHIGDYGADCSGFISKVWQHPNAMPLEVNKHPYSTADYIKEDGPYWSAIDRQSAKPGDSLVQRSGGSGHIVLIIEKHDSWMQPNVIEAQGCATGIVKNVRKFGSEYKARRLK